MNAMQLLEAINDIEGALIENAQPMQKKNSRTFAKIVLLAALVAVLAMSAFAAEEITNWFQSYFVGLSEDSLTENQIIFLEDNTTDNVQSKTSNGYTITLEAAITDGKHGYLKLRLIAPEGTDLDASGYFPGNIEYFDCLRPVQNSDVTTTGDAEACAVGIGWKTLDDNDGKTNTVTLLCDLDGIFRDNRKWQLHIEDIKGTYYENPGTEAYRIWEETIAEGTWDFDVVFPQSGFEEVELISEPVAGQVDIGLDKKRYENVMITSFKLRAMSAEITYEYLDQVHGAGDFDTIHVVMKNGERIELHDASAHPGYCSFRTREPIVLTDVDHVRLPDGIKLPIP